MEPPTATPLPWGRLAVLLPVCLSDALALCAVSPFLPFMVQNLLQLPPEDQHQIGYDVGLLCVVYSGGQMLMSPVLGALADRHGRRPVILVTVLMNAALMLGFGFSTSFRVAVLLRLCQGLSAGAMIAGRAYIADITDDTNETSAFALLGLVWGTGDILGPILGGLLAEPVEQYPAWFARQPRFFEDALSTYPYVLPCAVASAVGLLTFLLACALLPESLRSCSSEHEPSSGKTDGGLWVMCRSNARLVRVFGASFVFGSGIGAFDPIIPVWARDQLHFSPGDLGIVQSATGVISIGASFFLIKFLNGRFGNVNGWCIALMIMTLGYITPGIYIALGLPGGVSGHWACLFVSYGFKALGVETCFTGTVLLLKECVQPESFGAANGLGTGILTAGLAIGPAWGPPLYAVSSENGSGIAPFLVLLLHSFVAVALVCSCSPAGCGGGRRLAGAGMQQPMLAGAAVS